MERETGASSHVRDAHFPGDQPDNHIVTNANAREGTKPYQWVDSSFPFPPFLSLFLSMEDAVPPVSSSACVVPDDRYSMKQLCTHRDIWFGELTSGRCYYFRHGHSLFVISLN